MFVAITGKCATTFFIDTGAQVSMIDHRTYEGKGPLKKQALSVVGGNGAINTYPIVQAKLILSNGRTVRPLLLLGKMNILGMDILKGQSWIDSWGKWEIGSPPVTGKTNLHMIKPINLLQIALPLPNSKPVNIPQYKLPAPTIKPVTELVKQLEQWSIIEKKKHSPYNSPIWSVKKTRRDMAHDY